MTVSIGSNWTRSRYFMGGLASLPGRSQDDRFWVVVAPVLWVTRLGVAKGIGGKAPGPGDDKGAIAAGHFQQLQRIDGQLGLEEHLDIVEQDHLGATAGQKV